MRAVAFLGVVALAAMMTSCARFGEKVDMYASKAWNEIKDVLPNPNPMPPGPREYERGKVVNNMYQNKCYKCELKLRTDWTSQVVYTNMFLNVFKPGRRNLYLMASKTDRSPAMLATLSIYPLASGEPSAGIGELAQRLDKRKTYQNLGSKEISIPGMKIAQRRDYRSKYNGKQDSPVNVRSAVLLSVREGYGFILEISAFETEFNEQQEAISELLSGFREYE